MLDASDFVDGVDFRVSVPVSLWKAEGQNADQQYRIGGVASTEIKDREDEVVLQSGLDWSDALKAGWFNDNHGKGTTDIVGYPDTVRRYAKGAVLPDGQRAIANCTWVEGWLLPIDRWPRAREIWNLGKALEGTPRSLRFSVEGRVTQRQGQDRKIVSRAKVRNIAITNAPINDDTYMACLNKALRAAARGACARTIAKALGMGAASPGVAPTGPQTGMGAGQVLAPESLEQDEPRCTRCPNSRCRCNRNKKVRKSLTNEQAVEYVRARLPHVSVETAGRLVAVTRQLKAAGRL